MITDRFRMTSTRPGSYEIHIGDQDVGRTLCDGVEISARFGDAPVVTVHPCVLEVDVDLPDARLFLSEETEALLARFGWTPPPDAKLVRPGAVGVPVDDVPTLPAGEVREVVTGRGGARWVAEFTHEPTGLTTTVTSGLSCGDARAGALRKLRERVHEYRTAAEAGRG